MTVHGGRDFLCLVVDCELVGGCVHKDEKKEEVGHATLWGQLATIFHDYLSSFLLTIQHCPNNIWRCPEMPCPAAQPVDGVAWRV